MITSKKINYLAYALMLICVIFAFLWIGRKVSGSTASVYEQKIFNGNIIDFQIIVDEAEFKELCENATAEEYILCDILINGDRINSVGIRAKGNSSLSMVASNEDSDRYSFKIKFDQYIPGQTFYGLDEMVVNNCIGDNTYMKEYVSYDIMKSLGVEIPLMEYANIKINGEDWGLYLALECYEESFLNRAYNDISGELYSVKMSRTKRDEVDGNMQDIKPENGKMEIINIITDENQMPNENGEQMPPMQNGGQMPNANQTQNGNQRQRGNMNQNNTQENGNNAPIIQNNNTIPAQNGEQGGPQFNMGMGGGENGGSLEYSDDDPDSYPSIFENAVFNPTESDKQNVITALKNLSEGKELEKYFDVDEILRYLAAHTYVVNLDSYSSNMAQNYYIYENGGKVSILPWDYNLSFGGFMQSSSSDMINFPIDTPVSGVDMETRPLIAKLLENEEYKAKYHQYLQEIVNKYSANYVESLIDSLDAKISNYVENDKTAFVKFDDYKKSLETFKNVLKLRAESVQGQLSGDIPATTEEQKNSDKLISTADINVNDLGSQGGGMRFGGQNAGGAQNQGERNQMRGPGVDIEKMQKAMEIVNSNGGEMNDEVKQKLKDEGFTDEEIEMLSNTRIMINGQQFGNRMQNGGFGENMTQNSEQTLQNNMILLGASGGALVLGLLFAFGFKRKF